MAAITTLPNPESPGKQVVQVVARNTAFMLGGQILVKIVAFIFSIFAVRHLGAALFGSYAAALAYVSIFAMFTDLGTSAYSVREMARVPENIAWMIPDIMALRVLLALVMIGFVTASAWWLGKSSFEVLGILIASCGLLLYAFQGPLDSVMIALERLDFSALFNLFEKLVFMLLGVILLLLGTGYHGLLGAMLVSVGVGGLALWFVARRFLRLSFERPAPRRWPALLRASFPFGITGATREFSRRFDLVFMSFVLPSAAVGWYSVPFNMIMTLLIVAQSLAIAMYPSMVREYDSGRGSIQHTVQRALCYLLLLSFPIAIGGSLLSHKIIPVLYGSEFVPSIAVMQVMVWVMPLLFVTELLGRTGSTLHLEGRIAQMSIFHAFINIVLNIVLITRYGIMGAVVALLIARLIFVIWLVMLIGPKLVFQHNIVPLLRVAGAGLLMGSSIWLLRLSGVVSHWHPVLELFGLLMAGGVSYVVAVLLVGAVSRSERKYLLSMIRYYFNVIFRRQNGACVS